MHNRRCSDVAKRNLRNRKHPRLCPVWGEIGEIINHSNDNLALAGLWKMREFLLRRFRFALPPVRHFTPLAGLKIEKQKFYGLKKSV
ncbi:MAG: hypothetical protein LBE12_16980 [Planctomycetaceae bacterium]|nr:hypothetical protein [Planctomycetaceae bacterium]